MARTAKNGEVNRSAAIRDIYAQHPEIKAKDVVAMLAEKGVKVTSSLVYLVKGKISGEKKHQRKVHKAVEKVAAASGNRDAVSTILKVKKFAGEVGGLGTLKAARGCTHPGNATTTLTLSETASTRIATKRHKKAQESKTGGQLRTGRAY